MKSIVIYDSISGNTKKIAEAIHAGMSQRGEQCDIARLRDVYTTDLLGYDLIGLGSPVMHRRELRNVTNFIWDIMDSLDGKHSFAFCTHGAFLANYLARVVTAMIQKGLIVIGWNDWYGSAYYATNPKPYFTDGHPDAIDLREAEDFGREMVERSRRISLGETQLIPTLPKGKEYKELYEPGSPPTKEQYDKMMKAIAHVVFRVNLKKCNYPKCTLCVDNCPMGSIDFSTSPPLFDSDCDKCFLCEMACPRGAVEADYSGFIAAYGPEMFIPLEKSLEIYEARGRFRRLVPPEKIGWNTPTYTLKHPRFKIR